MPVFEVSIVYKGQRNYIVLAGDKEFAESRAMERYMNGEDGEMLGTEYEEVENIVARPINAEN